MKSRESKESQHHQFTRKFHLEYEQMQVDLCVFPRWRVT